MFDWQQARFVAKKRFQYGRDGNGEARIVYPGEYLDPAGLINDRLLFGANSDWITAAPGGKREDWGCDRCGRQFMTETQLRAHQRVTATLENTAPDHVASLREQAADRATRTLQNETIADLALAKGHHVDMRRSSHSRRDIPVVRAG